ncbi:MAG TPA: CDP-glycerol glycerophosphotransferase family protein, partial [Nitrososphaera sp.]
MQRDKDLIFVFEEAGAAELIGSVKKRQNEVVVICANHDLKVRLSGAEYTCRLLGEYSQGNSDGRNVLSWIQTWPDIPVLGGRSFKELLVYKGISIFWFLQTRLYLHRMQELLLMIERLKAAVAAECPTDVWVTGNPDARYIISVLQGKSLDGDLASGSNIGYKSYSGLPTLKLLLLKIMRGMFVRTGGGARKKEGKILVVSAGTSWRRDFDFKSQKYVVRDVFFHAIVERLSGLGYDLTAIDFENRANRLPRAYLDNVERRKSFGVAVVPWEKYVDWGIITKSRQAAKELSGTWKKLQISKEFADSLVYSGVPLYRLVKSDFEGLFKSLKAFAAVSFIEAAEKILEAEKPLAVIMHDEYGAIQMSLINAAKKKGIPTISLQHGMIYPDHLSYVHELSHIQGKNPDTLFPLPDRMCVWSERAKQILLKIGNFPPAVPVVTGDPRVDYLHEARSSFDRKKITRGLGVPDIKKIVMFATDNLQDADEKILVAKSVFRAVKTLPECFLIVKVHPNEEDHAFYQKLAEEMALPEAVVVRNVNLYELLYISNVIIVTFSTVGAEALRMGKPVISLNLTRPHDVPFVRENMAEVVRSADAVAASLRKCLDKEVIGEERMKKFA